MKWNLDWMGPDLFNGDVSIIGRWPIFNVRMRCYALFFGNGLFSMKSLKN
jgi:hypothetical protein